MGPLPLAAVAPIRLRLRRRRRRKPMTAHDLGHLGSVRWAPGGRIDDRGGLTEKVRSDGGRRDHAERLGLPISVVLEPVHGTARDAERLAGSDLDGPSVHGPRQRAFDAVDGLFVMIVAMGWPQQAL